MYKIIFLRVLLVFVVIYVAQFFLPENLNGFPYGDNIKSLYQMPHVISATANFDGVHYTKIAHEGYHQFDQAFFPLYPILLAGAGQVLKNNHIIGGIIISILGTFLGCYYLFHVFKERYNNKKALQLITIFLIFPTAFFTQLVYSEGLFFALVAGSLFYLYKKNILLACILAGLASFTKLHGIFLVILFFFHFYDVKKSLPANIMSILKTKWIIMLSPFIGLFVYMAYLYMTTGDALYFFTSQPSFGANRSTNIILLPQVYYRYLKIFITANPNYQYFVAALEFTFFTISFIASGYIAYKAYKQRNMFELGLAIFSLCYLTLPTLTGTFSSIPRYALFAFAQYIAFIRIPSKNIQSALLILFLLLQITLLSLFSRGYFVG